MIPATALTRARALWAHDDPVVLAARPRGVLHLYRGPLTPGGGIPRTRRPVCRRRSRRLYVAEVPPCLSAVPAMRRLCRSCAARLESPPPRPEPGPLSPDDFLLTVLAARDERDLAACRRVLLLRMPPQLWCRPVDLPPTAARRWRRPRISPQQAIHVERGQLRLDALHDRLDQTVEPLPA